MIRAQPTPVGCKNGRKPKSAPCLRPTSQTPPSSFLVTKNEAREQSKNKSQISNLSSIGVE